MNRNEVIKYPILTEKSYTLMGQGVYTFAVDKRTNKIEVKKTVEFIFGVKVAKVNIANITKKATKLGRFAGFTTAYKRAVITLKEGQINIFPEEVSKEEAFKEKYNKEVKEIKSDEPSEAELKAAAKIQAKVEEKEAELKAATKIQAKVEEKEEMKNIEEKPVKADK